MKQLIIVCTTMMVLLCLGATDDLVYALGVVNDTPSSDRAVLFEPCTFDVGSDAGPLEDSSTKQGYTYLHLANERATLDQFVAIINRYGVLQLSSHGSARSFVVECYPGTSTGRRARDDAFSDYVSGANLTGKNPEGLALAAGNCIQKAKGIRAGRRYWLVGPRERTYYGIRILDGCIRQLTAAAANAPIIIAGSCFSWGLRDDFLNVREFFGYDALCAGPTLRRDVQLLLRRMDGRAAPRGLARPVHGGPGALPDGTSTAFGRGGFSAFFSHLGPGNTTLSPTVNSGDAEPSFAPQGRVQPMSTVPGWVIFDTNMVTDVPPASVVSVQQNGCTATLDNIRWTGTRRLDFDVVVGEGDAEGFLLFLVKANTALSAQNQTRLDGNLTPALLNGVAPNADDFQWEVSCGEPGTIPEVARSPAGQSSARLISHDRSDRTQSPSFVATRAISVAVVEPELLLVGEAGGVASGIFQLENGGLDPDLAFFDATDLRLASTVIPSTAITIPTSFTVLAPQSRSPVIIEIAIPALQPTGVYSGAINIFTGGGAALSIPIRLFVNQTPVLSIPEAQTILPGQTLTLTVTATDADGEPILLYAEPLPDGDSESVATFTDNGDGSATLVFTPEPQMAGTILSVPLIASNAYPFDPDVIDSYDFPAHIPHAVQEVTIVVLNQIYLPLVTSG